MDDGTAIRFLTNANGGGQIGIDIPAGLSRLSFPAGPDGHPVPACSAADGPAGCATVEVVRGGSRPVVLLVADDERSVRQNGLPAPELAVLGIRDEVRVRGHAPLHLSVWREPRLAPAPEEHREQKCPLCTTPLRTGTTYLCSCGLYLHLNGEEVSERDRLECARTVSICPSCEAEIRLTPGFLYVPGDDR